MNNSINHKFHHISRAEYQELLAVSRGLLLMPNVAMGRNLLLPKKHGCICWKALIDGGQMGRKEVLL